MALGFEGYVKVGNTWTLGTGVSVPRARVRIETAGAYAGQIVNPNMAIGNGRVYDWGQYDGSINFELTKDLWKNELKPWVFARQTAKDILFATRFDNVQSYEAATAFPMWNNISLNASEGAAITGSFGFVAVNRTDYEYGDDGLVDPSVTRMGSELIPAGDGFPDPLNKNSLNINPIPYWQSKFVPTIGGAPVTLKTIDWTLDFSQDVVKFFGCPAVNPGIDLGAVAPKYMAVGPMTVTFSFSHIGDALPDTIASATLTIVGAESITLKKLEDTHFSDDMQTGNTLTPTSMEYAVYELAL